MEGQERCRWVWDPTSARFSACALNYLPIVPAAFIALIGLCFVFQPVIRRWRPAWTTPFVQEYPQPTGELPQNGATRSRWMWTTLLSILAVGSTAAQLAQQLVPSGMSNSAVILLLVSWALVVFLIVAKRPRTCATSLLLFYIPAFAVHLAILLGPSPVPKTARIAQGVSAVFGAVSVILVLSMPYRPPSWPAKDISALGATPKDTLRSPEDNLRMYQFLTVSWMGPLISVGKHGNLEESNIWRLPFQFQSKRLHETFRFLQGTVLRRLCKANAVDFVILGVVSLSELVFESVLPLLLNQLLRAMENPLSTKRVVMIYAILSLVVRISVAQCEVLLSWYGRRCYERSRAEMTMMIFEKALCRKNVIGAITAPTSINNTVQPQGGRHTNTPNLGGIMAKFSRAFGKAASVFRSKESTRPADTKQVASIGTILNLFRGDVYEVAQRFWELDKLFKGPLGLIFSAALVWKFLGPSCFLGIISLIVAQTVNAFLTRKLIQYGRSRKKETDNRLQLTSHFIEVIRHLRWYGWQGHWLKQINESREKELMTRLRFMLLETTIRFINVLSSSLFPVIALYAYTTLEKRPLSIDIIFPALQFFQMLESRLRQIPDLITLMTNASVSLRRIEEFMSEAEVEAPQHIAQDDQDLALEDCSFGWPESSQPVLKGVNITFPKGLTVVYGKVGAGKTALLQTLLGEMDRFSGTYHLPNHSVGYCAQTPWLQSMSIRENILFFSPHEDLFYNQVLDACQLVPDLRLLKDGDRSILGENGIGLSGGQRARVALARAIYSRPKILLLDDPLSALDHDTADAIVKKLLRGSLLDGCTTVLATHRVNLVLPYANQLVEVADGHVKVSKPETPFAFVVQSLSQAEGDEVDMGEEESRKPSIAAAKFMEDEQRAKFGVRAKVYWAYVKAGGLHWWLLEVIALAISQLLDVLYAWYLKAWGEAYHPATLFLLQVRIDTLAQLNLFNPIANFPPPEENVTPWLLVYLGISLLQPLTTLTFMVFQTIIVYCAAKRLFKDVLVMVANATFRFYDVTPTGRLMNRMTSDISNVDGNVSNQFVRFVLYIIAFATSVSVIASVAPLFLIAAVLFMYTLVYIFQNYLPTSQSLRRMETVSLSPLFANFGELLQGLITIRAFKAQEQFQSRVIAVVDQCQRMDHFYWTLQAWLMYRFDALSASSTFILTALAVYSNLSPGLTAFVLIAAQNFVKSTHALCRQYGRLQMDFVSVERVEELLHIEQEPKGHIQPPASWPKYGGDIVFENATIRYAPHMDPALKDISVSIKGGSSVALVGRTGSGKSTFVQALLAIVRTDSGSIFVDGIDVNEVDVAVLRDRATYVAQDPVLFSGTIRDNLDPIRQFSDEECLSALRRVSTRPRWTLDTRIEAGGSNLSQGERQLIGITRGILRRSSILIMDEATASIDYETAMEIQKVLREEMNESTVITIAHRVEAVRDVDYAIVLREGRVERFGAPSEVLS